MQEELEGMKLSLGANKRLKSQKSIERLFESGNRLHKYPIRAVFQFTEDATSEFQIAVSVPKKLVKKATNRNLIKRRMREAFRLNQAQLKISKKMEVMFIFSTKDLEEYAVIEKAIRVLIDSLNSLSNDNNEGK